MTAGPYPALVDLPSLPPARYLLKPLDGNAEAAVSDASAAAASRLLARLIAGPGGEPVDVARLPAAVHDRLLACLYQAELGDSVTAQSTCGACGEPFRFALSIDDLLAEQDEAAAAVGQPDAEGYWTGPGGARLRPPTLADAGAPAPAALLERIADGAVAPDLVEPLSAFLEKASPLLALDLDTHCPACGAAQRIGFDLARFLAQALAGERPFLIRETHLIAARYGWGHAEIMALPRADRRAYAALIEAERSAALRRVS